MPVSGSGSRYPNACRRLRVLVVGASGTFGARLVRLLSAEPGVETLAFARRAVPLGSLAASLEGVTAWAGERDALCAERLRERRVDVVIDASGPFPLARPTLVEAAVGAGAHYVDLADCRDFVLGIRRFDAAARRAGIAVLSGASTTPALSHAALDRLTAGWRRVDVVEVLISPSNRQRVGLAVARTMLAGLGRPHRAFDGGAWTVRTGWGSPRPVSLPGAGRRLAAPVDVPDLELLVERYRPTRAARFEAALGLPLEQRVLGGLAALVRHGVLRSALPLARPGRWAVNALSRFGRDVGVMRVRACGRDAGGAPVRAEWVLQASGATGPVVPTLAALNVVRRLRDGTLGPVGAAPCAGTLGLDDFEPDFARLGIRTEVRSGSRDGLGRASRPSPRPRALRRCPWIRRSPGSPPTARVDRPSRSSPRTRDRA